MIFQLQSHNSTHLICGAQDKGACTHVPACRLKAVFVHPEQWGMWLVNTTHNKNNKIRLPLLSRWLFFLLILSHNGNKNCIKSLNLKSPKLTWQCAEVFTQTSSAFRICTKHSHQLPPKASLRLHQELDQCFTPKAKIIFIK